MTVKELYELCCSAGSENQEIAIYVESECCAEYYGTVEPENVSFYDDVCVYV